MKWMLYFFALLFLVVSCRVSQPDIETMKNVIIEELCATKGKPSLALKDYGVKLYGNWTQEEVKEILACLNILTFRMPKHVIKKHNLCITKIKFNPDVYQMHLAEYQQNYQKKYSDIPEIPPVMGYTLDHLGVGLTAHARSDCGIFMLPLVVMNEFEAWAGKYKTAPASHFLWQSSMFRQFLIHEIMHCFLFDLPGYKAFYAKKKKNLGHYFQPWADLEEKITKEATSLALTHFENYRPELRELKVSYPTRYSEKNCVETMADCFAYFVLRETFKHYDPWLAQRMVLIRDLLLKIEKKFN